MTKWQTIVARIMQGHRVASGLNQNPLFPGGTLRMQSPHFLARGFDLGAFYLGTLNVSIAPHVYRVIKPRHTFRNVKWHPSEPAEDFSFFNARLMSPNGESVVGWIYYPHSETKPAHFQPPEMLELLLPFVEGLCYGSSVNLEVPKQQMIVESPAGQSAKMV